MRNGRGRDCEESEDAIRVGLVDSAEGFRRILLMALPGEALESNSSHCRITATE